MYRMVVGFGVMGLLAAEAQASDGWQYKGTASVLRWKTTDQEWNNSDVYGTNYPGDVEPNTGSRTIGSACRGWARDIAREHYHVSKWAVGEDESEWPPGDQFDKAYSDSTQRVVRLKWRRWTTTEWWGFIPYPKNHCRVTAEEYAENLELDSGQDFEQGDVLYWVNADASNNPDFVGAALQATAPEPLAGKAAHVGMCSQVSMGECYALFHAHDYGRLEGVIGHLNNWTLNVGEFLYQELQAGLDGWGVRGTHTTIPENVGRQIYVYRNCNTARRDLALWRFWSNFEPDTGYTQLPASERLYRVAAFTQTGTAELEYGQCAATSESLWDLSAAEGGNALSASGEEYETMIGDAWDNAHDFLDNNANTFWEGLFGNERRVASVVLHSFTDTGKTWNEVKDPDSDSAAREYAMESAAEKNPDGLSGINSAVLHYLQFDSLSADGCTLTPIDWDEIDVKDWDKSLVSVIPAETFDPSLTVESVDAAAAVEAKFVESDLDIAFGGDGPAEEFELSESPCQPGTAGLRIYGEATSCYGAFISPDAVATTAACVAGLSAWDLEVSSCDVSAPVKSVSLHPDPAVDLAVIHLGTSMPVKELPISSSLPEVGAVVTQYNYFAEPLTVLASADAAAVYEKLLADSTATLVESEYPYADAEGSPIVDANGQLVGLSTNDTAEDGGIRSHVSASVHYDWLSDEAGTATIVEVSAVKDVVRR